ncbi:hypothetical protein RYA05_00270 [Pseudomonas syringae pv. actinidiae]|nr:hypothetical protein [Pseudomonas syringae pv. actinidiae]
MNTNNIAENLTKHEHFTEADLEALVDANTRVRTKAEEVFKYWVEKIREVKDDLSIDSLDLDYGNVIVETSHYIGCGDYENGSYLMPHKYLLSQDYKSLIDEEVAVRAVKRKEEEVQKNRAIALQQAQAKQEQRDREYAEYLRLQSLYGAPESVANGDKP